MGGAFLSVAGDEGEASASAVSATADDNTASDYEKLQGEAWPHEPVRCLDFGTDPGSEETAGAEASCAWGDRTVSAEGSNDGATVAELVKVGSSSSRSEVRLDPERGLVATVHAEARNVTIGDAVEIGYVGASIEVASRGAPGSASASYERVFRDVTAGSFSCGSADSCAIPETLAAISRALGSQFRVELPPAEVIQTPGGARAHVLMDRWAHQQDVVLNDQEQTEVQVPALRLIHIGDNASPSRTIVEFAAVGGSATYLPVGPGAGPLLDPLAPPFPPTHGVAPPRTGPVDEPPVGPVAADAPTLIERVAQGWRVLMRDPVQALLAMSILAIFGLPVLLGARRRHALRLAGLR